MPSLAFEHDRVIEAPTLVRRAPAPPPLDVADERAARRSLRSQIARLEGELARLMACDDAPPLVFDSPYRPRHRPHVLDLGELERCRDRLLQHVGAARGEAAALAGARDAARRKLEAMRRDPAAHPFARVAREDVGERGCGGWEVRPRLGPVGLLCGWWRVVISSGCP